MSRTHLMAAPQRPRTRTVTAGTVVAALVLSFFATLLGPLGVLPSAHAEDGNPTFHLGSDDGTAYVNFINSIRGAVNDGGSTVVPGAGNAYQVDHTDPRNGARYLQVDIHMYTGGFVRLQLDRTNLYLLGWWANDNTYYYLGTRPNNTPDYGERSRMDNGRRVDAGGWRQIGDEN